MSVDLRNKQGQEFYFSSVSWAFYLNLAIIYGWKTAGTLAPEEWDTAQGKWQGVYDWNAGQTVTEFDANAFASALKKYLDDPNGNLKANALAKELGKAIGADVVVNSEDRELIISFISFATSGEFQIW